MKVGELLCKCYNCDYSRTMVTIYDACGGRFRAVPNAIPDFMKSMYVQNFRLGYVKKERLTALDITIEGRDKI